MEYVLDNCTDLQFFKNTRLSRECFAALQEVLEPHLLRQREVLSGRSPIGTKMTILLALWYLANQTTYREIAKEFGVTESTVHKAVKVVVKELNNLQGRFIKWPSAPEIVQEEQHFLQISRIEGTIGAIDGCHVKIKSPAERLQDSYINRNHYHSINLMAVCDTKMKFTFASAGMPGSVHDQRVLGESGLWIINCW